MKKIIFITVLLSSFFGINTNIIAQCTNTSAYGSGTASTNVGTSVTLSTCNYSGEYATITGVQSGGTYRVNSSLTTSWVTIRSGTYNGPVVSFAVQGTNWVAPTSGTYYAHFNNNSSCATATVCRTTSITTVALPVLANPCNSISALTCGASSSFSLGGSGSWSSLGSPYNTPGSEKVYSFTPTVTGTHSVTIANSEYFVDLFYKSGTCGNTGWTYVDDISSSGATNTINLTAGTAYLFLIDDENTTIGTGSLTIACPTPAPDPCNNNIINISTCGLNTNFNLTSGNGVWNNYGGAYSVPGRENIFRFTPSVTASYPVTISNTTSGYVDLFYKAQGGACNSTGWIYVDDITGSATNNITLTAGVTYNFLLDDENTVASTGTISLGCPCLGNSIDHTFTAPFTHSSTTIGACNDCSLRASNEKTYEVNITCNGNYTFSLCNSSYDTYMYLTTAACGGTTLASNDDYCSLQSQISTYLNAGTYYVSIEGFSSFSEGSYTLNVTGNDAPVVTLNTTNANCNGSANGSISVSASGGCGFEYSLNNGVYQSSNSFSGLSAGNYNVTVRNSFGNTTQSSTTISEPTAISATITSSVPNAAMCVGGTTALTASVTGGSGLLNYQWQYNNGTSWVNITGVSASGSATSPFNTTQNASPSSTKDYRVVITSSINSSCSASASQLVSISPDPTLTISSTNVTCKGLYNGSADAILSGGTISPSYTFNWSPGTPNGDGTLSVNNLGPGTYNLTASGNYGCYASSSVTITEPQQLTVSSSATEILCNGGLSVLNLTANGGTAPYIGDGIYSVNAGDYAYTVTDANGCSVNVLGTILEPSLLTASSSATPILCNGGTSVVTVTANGGTTPYTSDGNYTVFAGNYSYIVTDANGCTANVSGTVSEPSLLTTSSSSTQILCNGGTSVVTVTANGGTTPYTSDGNYTVFAGNYSYTVTDANGCTANVSGTVTEPSLLTASSSATPILCNGGSSVVTVTANGGTTPYSGDGNYTVFAGNYSYTVTDANGCTANVSGTVTEPSLLTASSSATPILCNGGTSVVTVNANGGTTPYTGNGNYTVSAGDYSYIVTDANGCTVNVSISISEPSLLTVNAGQDQVVYYGYSPLSCANINATSTGGTGTISYTWNNGANGSSISVCPTTTQIYTVTATDLNGCIAVDDIRICSIDVICYAGNSNVQKVEVCHNGNTICINASAVPAHLAHGCSIGACNEINSCNTNSRVVASGSIINNDEHQIELYPNPAINQISILIDDETITEGTAYSIINMIGQEVSKGTLQANETSIDISNFNAGMYYFKTENNSHKPIIFLKK